MTVQDTQENVEQENPLVGFAILDDRGRVALTKATRQALGLHSGSSLVYVVVEGAIMLIPQDTYLAEISERATRILDNSDLTVDDLLAELPTVREEIMREEYGDAFVNALATAHAALHNSHS